MLTLIGVQRKTGNYEGNAYDNFNLHCINDTPPSPTICGNVCEIVKLKAARVHDAFDGLVSNDSDWRNLIGSKIRVSYDRYGSAEHIEIIDLGEKG